MVDPQTLPGGLLAWWKMDDDSNPGLDSSGNGFNGATIGSLTSVTGANASTGGALSFGAGNYINVPAGPYLNPASFTFVGWAKPAGISGDQSFVTSRYDQFAATSNTYGYIFYITAGKWDFWNGASNAPQSWEKLPASAPAAGAWQHIAFSYDAATKTKTVYINGVQAATGVTAAPYQRNLVKDLHLGSGGDNGGPLPFAGGIDDVAIFSTVLSSAQIATIASAGVSEFLNPNSGSNFAINVVSFDDSNLVIDVTGTSSGPGITYKITKSPTLLPGSFVDTGISFDSTTASGISIPITPGPEPTMFYRAESVTTP
jgi:hypothetical protein